MLQHWHEPNQDCDFVFTAYSLSSQLAQFQHTETKMSKCSHVEIYCTDKNPELTMVIYVDK